MRSILVWTLLPLALLISCRAASAQTAQISGLITDSQKAAVSGADVRIVDQATGVERHTASNAGGYYVAPFLQPGNYKVFVQATGFDTSVSGAVVLTVGQALGLNFQMHVGSVQEQVTVDGNEADINTTDASVSTVVDRQFVENLPLNGRSFQALLSLTPGIAPNIASGNSDLAQGQFVVNGQRGDANYWTIDGAGANVGLSQFQPGPGLTGALGGVNVLGGTSALVSVDAMQEFRAQTSTYAPEFGRGMGGQISILTRSGTNRFHGTVFNYLRNGDLDASDWFAEHNGLPKPLEVQNDFGGVLGGPIIKDKTFFFFSAEALRLHLPQTFIGTVPDLPTRASAVPAMQPYLNAYPLPKPGAVAVDGIAPYSATYSDPGTADAYSLRIDHQLLANLSLFARYSHAPSSVAQHGSDANVGNSILTTRSVTKTGTVGATWTQSARLADDFRFNYSVAGGKAYYDIVTLDGSSQFPDTNLFAPGQNLTYQNSDMYMLQEFGSNMRQWLGLVVNDHQYHHNLVDSLTLQEKSHALKFGVDYRWLTPTLEFGIEQLVPVFDTLQHFAQGISPTTYIYYNQPANIKLQNLTVYGQDTWRVNPRFNLTYGLRWDVDFSPQFLQGNSLAAITGFSTTNLANLGLAPLGTAPYKTRFGNVAPRIGGAYRLRTSPEFGVVLRAGFGVIYGLSSTEIVNATYTQGVYPVGAVNNLSNVTFPTPAAIGGLPAIVAPNLENGGTLAGFDPNLNQPYALEWNASLEQSLGTAQTFTLSYVGAADKRLLTTEFINNPNPNFASALLVANLGTSNYQSMQALFQRRLVNGLQAMLSYTWAHSIDLGSFGAYNNGSFANINANRGDSDFDVRNSFNAALTYAAPAFRANAFTRAVTGGWSTENIIGLHTGAPVDIQAAQFSALSAQGASILVRPDLVPGQPWYLSGPQYPGRKAINPGALANPPVDPNTQLPLRQGTLGRNVFRDLGFSQWDFAARRDFALYESLRLQFRAEMFNLLNHPNFGPFDSSFGNGDPYFGQPTQMLNQFLGGISGNGTQNPLYTPGSPRSVELALKLVF
jgi:hypothetical protein